jgi:cytidylate kinase
VSGRRRPVVAIDGPAGAGKTTVTRRVAEQLGYLLVGTGSLYRSVALAAKRRGVGWDDGPALGRLARQLASSGAVRLETTPTGERVLLEGEDVSGAIRAEEVGVGASQVSAQPEVRAALLQLQRAAGARGGVVLEGRDIGTTVFPDAEAKFFLTASAKVRAERRCRELRARGGRADLDEVMREVEARDHRDRERAIAPLRQAPDAMLIDSSELTIEQVVDLIVAQVRDLEADPGRKG